MNLKEWAKQEGVSYSTAVQWFRDGKLPVEARKVGGLILVGDLTEHTKPREPKVVVYARVSSSDQRDDLDRQVSRVVQWATGEGMEVSRTVTEVGSGLNGHRSKFRRLLADPSVTAIVVEHADRATRFGFDYIAAALSAQGRDIVVMDDTDRDDDVDADVHDFLTSVLARRYGQRSAAARAARAVADED